VLAVTRAIERRGLVARIGELEEDLSARTEFAGIVGRSEPIRAVLRRLARVAASDVTVLITGESGTGKELAAQSVHRASRRGPGPFVPVNCGAIAASLAESELFGHQRGAFTDAKSDHHGRFEQANGGTLFLDEVGDLPLDVQVKLLRALEAGEINRVGSERATSIDVRLIAATNHDLKRDVAEGRFREDLYWRLNVFPVEMPPLRDRVDDLRPLIDYLLDRARALHCSIRATVVTPAAFMRMRRYPWPGNVRQLANAILYGGLMAGDAAAIDVEHLSPDLLAWESNVGRGSTATLEIAMAEAERRLIEAALDHFGGNRTAAANALGIHERTLYKKLQTLRADSGPEAR
jgi:DNA-binding NtrC family response regulator